MDNRRRGDSQLKSRKREREFRGSCDLGDGFYKPRPAGASDVTLGLGSDWRISKLVGGWVRGWRGGGGR